jgi:UPF0176 protein
MKLWNKVNNDELKQKMIDSGEERITLSFYKYYHLSSPQTFRDEFYLKLDQVGVYGRIYVAQEGVNGQISVLGNRFDDFVSTLNSFPWLQGIRLNTAIEDNGKSFYKLKIKVRNKIVADGLNDDSFDVTKRGKHLSAIEVNSLLEKEDTLVVDMRNHYESEVGHFEKAICPDVETFREALPIVEKMLENDKDKTIIMYCTGGIRCEKASAYYLHKGFKEVCMIDGGIIEYSRQCKDLGLPNKFLGKNFVFDERMGERISDEILSVCHQCGNPSDNHINCANDACHILFIQCEQCANDYAHCCSTKCRDFIQLDSEQQEILKKKISFNGTKFGKGRYKAMKKDEVLEWIND